MLQVFKKPAKDAFLKHQLSFPCPQRRGRGGRRIVSTCSNCLDQLSRTYLEVYLYTNCWADWDVRMRHTHSLEDDQNSEQMPWNGVQYVTEPSSIGGAKDFWENLVKSGNQS